MSIKPNITPEIQKLLEDKSGIRLDVGCGENKNPGFVGIDILPLKGVDIVHNIELTPWPLPDECVTTATASHLLEHLNPTAGDARLDGLTKLLLQKKLISQQEVDEYMGLPGPAFIRVMNEIWRVLKPHGQFAFVVPHAESPGFTQDPTHCAIKGTEVKTREGFKPMEDVQIGEDVLTLNLETEQAEYSPCVKVINEPYEGPIVRFKNRAVDIAVTPNHDLISKTWQSGSRWTKRRADSFFGKPPFGRLGLATIPEWTTEAPEEIRVEDAAFNAGDFMEVLGWVLSEGGFSSGRYVNIYQLKSANPEKYARIAELLQRMKLEFTEHDNCLTIKSKLLYEHLSPLGKQEVRYIPATYKALSRDLLLRLLESLRMGDGEAHPAFDSNGGYTYTTISSKLASDVNEVALQCGFRSHIYVREGKEFVAPNGKIYTRKNQYRVSICPASENMWYPEPSTEQYEGDIVCVQVAKNSTILTRHNGHVVWMGNCNPISETTMHYFDPDPEHHNIGQSLYAFYRPKPWKIVRQYWSQAGNLEVLLEKRIDDISYHGTTVATSITEEAR